MFDRLFRLGAMFDEKDLEYLLRHARHKLLLKMNKRV